jgi:hypothetical protein
MKSRMARALSWLAAIEAGALVTALLTPGCGVSSASPTSSQVAGRVTHDGKPLTHGLIIFTPKDQSGGNWGAGQIDKNGRFKISTMQSTIVLEPGTYRIFFKPPAPASERRRGRLGIPEDNDGSDSTGELAPPKLDLPEKFYQPETSGLWVNIEREPNWIEINLKD